MRGCAEDALVDNPTRERGQWTGDVVSVGLDLISAGYGDLRLIRRGLFQTAWCAREDGHIAALCPGGLTYMSPFALQWVCACVHYYELTADRELLDQLHGYAIRNLALFERHFGPEGLTDLPDSHRFIDWGYVAPVDSIDIAYNIHYLLALRAMISWCQVIGSKDTVSYQQLELRLGGIITESIKSHFTRADTGIRELGYHSVALALKARLLGDDSQKHAVAYIKRHIISCFPNDPAAPKLSEPARAVNQLFTPYFAHFALPPLIECGEMEFVLDQYRKCWGWALEDGRSTMIEVFNLNWSHCHQWGCCPTWQLSRYALGLHPRFDRGRNHFELKLFPGTLRHASGRVPIPGTGHKIEVLWERDAQQINYRLNTEQEIHVVLPESAEPRIIKDVFTIKLPADGGRSV